MAQGRCPRSSSASSSPGSLCPAWGVLLAYKAWTSWAHGGQAKEKQEMGLPEPIRLMVQAHGQEASTDKRWESRQRESDDRTRPLLQANAHPYCPLLPTSQSRSHFQARLKCRLLQAALPEPPGGYDHPPGFLTALYLPLYRRKQEAFCSPLSSRG